MQRYRLVDALLETGVEFSYAWKDVNIIPARTLPAGALVVALTPLLDERSVTALVDLRGAAMISSCSRCRPSRTSSRRRTPSSELPSGSGGSSGRELRPLEPPEPEGNSLEDVRRRLEVRLGRHLEHDEIMAAPPQVDERRHGPFVEERRERHDERARRQRPRRDDVDVLPGVAELDAGLEQRVDEPVPLHEPASGLEPAQDPAERDETDPVPSLEEA